MKASEFLNKTKEEIQNQLDILLSNEYMQTEDLAAQVFLAQTLLSNDVVFKQSASTKEGRLQLLTLAESLKGINGVLKLAKEQNLTEEEIGEKIMSKLPSAVINAQARAIEYDDLEEDVQGATVQELKDFCKQTIITMVGMDDDFEEEDKEVIGNAFDKVFNEAIASLGFEDKTTFTEEEMTLVFSNITAKIQDENFDIEDYVNDKEEGEPELN